MESKWTGENTIRFHLAAVLSGRIPPGCECGYRQREKKTFSSPIHLMAYAPLLAEESVVYPLDTAYSCVGRYPERLVPVSPRYCLSQEAQGVACPSFRKGRTDVDYVTTYSVYLVKDEPAVEIVKGHFGVRRSQCGAG